MNNEELEKLLRKIIREETEPIHKRLDGLEKGQQRLEKGQEQLEQKVEKEAEGIINDMVSFFHETWDKMGETNERVTNIEDHLDLPHKN